MAETASLGYVTLLGMDNDSCRDSRLGLAAYASASRFFRCSMQRQFCTDYNSMLT